MNKSTAPRFLRLVGFALLALVALGWSGCASRPAPAPAHSATTTDYKAAPGPVGAYSPSPIKIRRQ